MFETKKLNKNLLLWGKERNIEIQLLLLYSEDNQMGIE